MSLLARTTSWLDVCLGSLHLGAIERLPTGARNVDDGLNIRWRQTAPDRSLVSLALDELGALHAQWPETVQCDIVIERAGPLGANLYRAGVEIDFGHVSRARGEGARAHAIALDIATALRVAFGKLRRRPRLAVAA